MVAYNLVVKFSTENIEKIFIANSDSFRWYLRIACYICKQEQSSEIYFTEEDEVETKGQKGFANFLMSCQECKHQMNIHVLPDSAKSITCAESGTTSGVFACLEFRNCEPLRWDPKAQLSAVAEESGTLFEDIDLSDFWGDYDEKGQANVTIELLSSSFEKAKQKK